MAINVLIGAGICYWAFCVGYMVWSTYTCDDDGLEKAFATFPQFRFVYWLQVVLLSPLILPLMAPTCFYQSWRETAQWQKSARQHHDYLCERIHPANLPRQVEAYFDNIGKQLAEWDFARVGDFHMAEQPLPMLMRGFRNADGTVIAEAIHIDDSCTFAFLSVFDDGFAIDTAAVESSDGLLLPNTTGRIGIHALGESISLEAALESHQQAIREREASHGSSLLAFVPDQLPAVWIYEKRLCSTLRSELGQMDGPIPEPVLPMPCGSHDETGNASQGQSEVVSLV